MNNSNKIVQALWIGDSLSVIEQLCIESYIKNGHIFHLYTYGDIQNVPSGTTILDANQIISHRKIFRDSEGSYAAFSDWFRYMMLYEKGGWWVDMDNVCLKPYDFPEDYCFSSEIHEKGMAITTGIIKAPEKAEFLEECLLCIEQQKRDNVLWGAFGPLFLKEILSIYDYSPYLKPPEIFCPVHFENFKDIIEKDIVLSSETYSVHLWNEMWRRNSIDKNINFKNTSTLERLKSIYLPSKI